MGLRAILLAMASAAGFAVASLAATAPAAEPCLTVQNTASFWVPGRIESRDHARSDFRLGAGEQQKVCLHGQPDEDGRLRLVIKNALGMPVFICRAKADTFVTIEAEKSDGKTRTYAVCQ